MAKIANEKLTDREYFFCHEYAKTLNATHSYKAAGYTARTDEIARSEASRLVAKPNIREYLADIFDFSTVTVLNEAIQIAFARITDIVDIEPGAVTVKPSAEWSDRARVSVKSVKIRTRSISSDDGTTETITDTEIVMHDKLAALEKLFKKLGLYPKNESVIDLIEAMAIQGLLVPAQAEVVRDGIGGIREKLRQLSSGATAADGNSPPV